MDDDPARRTVLEQYMKSWSMQPTSASDATSTLALLRQAAPAETPFDVALIDLGTLTLNGIELARMIKRDPLIAATPVIILTSYGQRGEAKLATEAGAAGYLTKPLGYAQLIECLRIVLVQSSGTIGSGGPSVDTRIGDGKPPPQTPRLTEFVTRHTAILLRRHEPSKLSAFSWRMTAKSIRCSSSVYSKGEAIGSMWLQMVRRPSRLSRSSTMVFFSSTVSCRI